MTLRFGILTIPMTLLVLLLGGCNSEPVADGESCAESSDCESELCATTGPGEGYCAGRECTVSGSTTECDPGYVCLGSSGGVFGGGNVPRCVATCGHCPEGLSCPAGAAPDDTRCAL